MAGDLQWMSEGIADPIGSAGKGLAMAQPLLPDELWELIRPLIPPHPPQPKGGRPFLDDRKVLTGILFILETGIPLEDLPQEMVRTDNASRGIYRQRIARHFAPPQPTAPREGWSGG